MQFEYTVIPAPTRTKNLKGVKTAGERLALALEDAINEMASNGWEYLRTETLTVEDKPGRFSKIVERIETVLVFRRQVQARAQMQAPVNLTSEPPLMMQKQEPKMSNGHEQHAPSLGGVSRD